MPTAVSTPATDSANSPWPTGIIPSDTESASTSAATFANSLSALVIRSTRKARSTVVHRRRNDTYWRRLRPGYAIRQSPLRSAASCRRSGPESPARPVAESVPRRSRTESSPVDRQSEAGRLYRSNVNQRGPISVRNCSPQPPNSVSAKPLPVGSTDSPGTPDHCPNRAASSRVYQCPQQQSHSPHHCS